MVWASSICLLAILVLVIAGLRRARLKSLNWPERLSYDAFQRMCGAYLRRSGWNVYFEGHPYLDLRAERDDLNCLLLCRVSGQLPGEVIVSTLSSLSTNGWRVVVVCLGLPNAEMASTLLSNGIHVIHYRDLKELDPIVRRGPAALMEDRLAAAAGTEHVDAWNTLRRADPPLQE